MAQQEAAAYASSPPIHTFFFKKNTFSLFDPSRPTPTPPQGARWSRRTSDSRYHSTGTPPALFYEKVSFKNLISTMGITKMILRAPSSGFGTPMSDRFLLLAGGARGTPRARSGVVGQLSGRRISHVPSDPRGAPAARAPGSEALSELFRNNSRNDANIGFWETPYLNFGSSLP